MKKLKRKTETTARNNHYILFPEIAPTKHTIIDIETLVKRLTSVLYLHVFQDAHLILLQSYSAEDVREKWAVVVQSEPRRERRISFTPEEGDEL